MAKPYPRCHNWLRFRRDGVGWVQVTDHLHGSAFRMDRRAARILQRLDGRSDPAAIDPSFPPEDLQQLLGDLEDLQLLRRGPVLRRSFGTVYLTLWQIPADLRLRARARLWDRALQILWAPALLLGLTLYLLLDPVGGPYWLSFPGYALGLLPGLFLHELGHAIAGLAHGAEVFELGLMLQFFLPGAYTGMDTGGVRDGLARAQIDGAGLESQALLAGLFLLLACCFPALDTLFFNAALVNIVLGLVNAGAAAGMDGGGVLAGLLDAPELVERSGQILRYRLLRDQLRREPTAPEDFALCLLVGLMRLGLPLMVLWGLGEVLLWIL